MTGMTVLSLSMNPIEDISPLTSLVNLKELGLRQNYINSLSGLETMVNLTRLDAANNQITEIAKKSPRAGLSHMGKALKRYYAENKAYPSRLMDLYPKYLDNKSLIEEIDWYYEPRGDDFYLSKTVIRGKKRIVASIDKTLRPQRQKDVMVATWDSTSCS